VEQLPEREAPVLNEPERRLAWSAGGSALLFLGFLLDVVFDGVLARHVDPWVSRQLALGDGPLRNVVEGLTQVGETLVLVFVCIAGSAYLLKQRARREVVVLWAGFVSVNAALWTIKYAVGRFRPGGVAADAFPSGHATLTLFTWTLVLILMTAAHARRRPDEWRPEVYRFALRIAAAAAVGIGLFVGSTRILLEVHWLTDVLGGWVLAVAFVCLSLVGWSWWLRRDGIPVGPDPDAVEGPAD
jgi:undecaprenyl-diphosphatase